MKRNMKKVVAIAFMLGMAAITSPVEAKTSTATLPVKKADIALGTKGVYQYDTTRKKYGKDAFDKGHYRIPIKKAVKGAKYICTTSDKKVATATVQDNRIQLTGLKAGKTTITCKQTLNGKTTVVGTMTVKVHNAKLKWGDHMFADAPYMGKGTMHTVVIVPTDKQKITEADYNYEAIIGNRGGFYIEWSSADKDVKYNLDVNKSGLKVTLKRTVISDYSLGGIGNRRTLNTYPEKAGTYKVSLTQEYRKNKVKSSTKATYYDSKAQKTAEMYLNRTEYAEFLLLSRISKEYIFEGVGIDITKKSSPVYMYKDSGSWMIKANKKGKYKIKAYYYDTVKKTKGKYLGTCELVVTKDPYQ